MQSKLGFTVPTPKDLHTSANASASRALFVPVFGESGLEETYFPGDGTLVPVARLIRETKPVVQLREAENTGSEFSSSRQ